jgi:hypothetical protein
MQLKANSVGDGFVAALFSVLVTLRKAPQRRAVPFWLSLCGWVVEALQLMSFALAGSHSFQWARDYMGWAAGLSEIARVDLLIGGAFQARLGALIFALVAVISAAALLGRRLLRSAATLRG